VRSYAAAADYWALTKPEINFLIAIATFARLLLGLSSSVSCLPDPVASGAGTLNQ